MTNSRPYWSMFFREQITSLVCITRRERLQKLVSIISSIRLHPRWEHLSFHSLSRNRIIFLLSRQPMIKKRKKVGRVGKRMVKVVQREILRVTQIGAVVTWSGAASY